jgi:KipI family sensor histidine kinase inhibitor
MSRPAQVTDLQVTDCGDAAVRVWCPDGDAERAWRRVHDLAGRLDVDRHRFHIRSVIPTYDAVLVEFDAEHTDHDAVRTLVRSAAGRPPRTDRRPSHFDVPVVYGGDHGPDLERVAREQDLTADRVVAIHTERPLVMRCYGSPGGAPMLDGPAFPHPVRRLASPRPGVPAGAVAVAGRQAVVSTRPAPGGWCVIGRTPRTLVEPARDPLSPFVPGDTFRFFPIGEQQWAEYTGPLDG